MTIKKLKSIDIINVLSDLVSEKMKTTVKLPKLYKHGMIEDYDYLKHWLIRVTINTCKDYRRVFYKKTINIEDVLIQDEKKDYELLPVILDMPTRYKFVAKKPHACVWDESYISLDKYFKK